MRDKVARALVIAGSVVLILSAGFHCLGGVKVGFPALRASDLAPALQTAFRVVFLSLAWHWFVLAWIALLAGLTETRIRRPLVLLCGLAVLIEAAGGVSQMGFFIGNEMIGAAGLLLLFGGILFA